MSSSSSSVDLGSLTEDQQLALQQLTSITDQEVGAGLELLRKCQWNTQIAIARFFDGDTETVDLAAEAARQAPPPMERQAINLQDSLNAGVFHSRRRGDALQPAPRVVSIPEDQMISRPPLLLSVIFFPFTLVYNIVYRIFGLVDHAFPSINRLFRLSIPTPSTTPPLVINRGPSSPEETAERFIHDLELKFAITPGDIPFQPCSYAHAYDLAKKDLKYLIVVLLSIEHEATASFVRNTLYSTTFTDFLRSHERRLLVWGGNVQGSEAYQVSSALGATKLPYISLIVHTPSSSITNSSISTINATTTSMSVIASVSGLTPPQTLISTFESAIRKHDSALSSLRAQRQEQSATRAIVQEQDSAYQRSLALDRERARKKREEDAERMRREELSRRQIEAEEKKADDIRRWRRWRADKLENDWEEMDAVRVSVRLPDGRRVLRRFRPDAQLDEVYAWVECVDVLDDATDMKQSQEEAPSDYQHDYGFVLVSPMPREVYDLKKGGTVRSRIGRNGNLIVEVLSPVAEKNMF